MDDRAPIRNPQGVHPPQREIRNLPVSHPWLPFLLPFIVYMAASMFEPTPPHGREGVAPIDAPNSLGIRYAHYPIVYSAKLALTIAAMLFVLPGYRQFPFRISLLAIVVGLVGGVLWIAICNLQLEQHLVDWLGPKSRAVGLLGLGERPSYNPLGQLAATPAWAYTFLAVRFVGLVLVVPVIEEFFLRGFLMRYVVSQNWWQVPFGEVNRAAVILGTLFPVLYHPEKLAALVWFSLVTWLMLRTKNIWDCVAAHAITNLMLGIYVVTQGEWRLW
ncbi:MAG: CAAX prenyl protease-related protein [Planctomycetes bacterium]|nr:CAAX prenyl protease-related protein [Planctomycetota bacterium]